MAKEVSGKESSVFFNEKELAAAQSGWLPVIDWQRPARDIVKDGLGVSYWRGTKWLLRPEEFPSHRTDLPPGEVSEVVNGPILVGAGDGSVMIHQYAVEGGQHQWLMAGLMADTLHLIEPAGWEKVVFESQRFHSWDNIINRFRVMVALQSRFSKCVPIDFDIFRDPLYWKNHEFLTTLLRNAGMRPGDRFLDVGCSSRPWAARIAHDFGMEVWACDIIPAQLFEKMEWLHYFEADVANFQDLPLPFDFIWSRCLTPIAFCRHFDYPEVRQFRDVLRNSLTEKGSCFMVIMSSNTGTPLHQDDFGQVTTAQIASFWGEGYPSVSVAKSTHISVHSSMRTPLDPNYTDTPQSRSIWNDLHKRHVSRRDLCHVLLQLSNRIWPLVGFEPKQRVHLLGEGEIANILYTILKEVHRTFPKVTLHEKVDTAATFVFVLPGATYHGPLPHYRITCQELIERYSRRDFWCVGGDYDDYTLARVEARLESRLVGFVADVRDKIGELFSATTGEDAEKTTLGKIANYLMAKRVKLRSNALLRKIMKKYW